MSNNNPLPVYAAEFDAIRTDCILPLESSNLKLVADGEFQFIREGESLFKIDQVKSEYDPSVDLTRITTRPTDVGIKLDPNNLHQTVALGNIEITNPPPHNANIVHSKVPLAFDAPRVDLNSSARVAHDLLVKGNIFSSSLVLENDSNIGYGFRVNDIGDLELYKYDKDKNITKQISRFGVGGNLVGSDTTNRFPEFGVSDSNSLDTIIELEDNENIKSRWEKRLTTDDIYYVNGKVGIGTTVPTELFEVAGRAKIDELDIGKIFSDLKVLESGVYDIGEEGKKWKDIYVDRVRLGNGDGDIYSTMDGINLSKSVLPGEPGLNLGLESNRWRNVYVEDGVHIGDATIKGVEGNLEIKGSLEPKEDGVYDIGSDMSMWKNLYLGGGGEIRISSTKIRNNDDETVLEVNKKLRVNDGIEIVFENGDVVDVGLLPTPTESNIGDVVKLERDLSGNFKFVFSEGFDLPEIKEGDRNKVLVVGPDLKYMHVDMGDELRSLQNQIDNIKKDMNNKDSIRFERFEIHEDDNKDSLLITDMWTSNVVVAFDA